MSYDGILSCPFPETAEQPFDEGPTVRIRLTRLANGTTRCSYQRTVTKPTEAYYAFTIVDPSRLQGLIQMQRQDPHLSLLIRYIEKGEVPASYDEFRRRHLHLESLDFILLEEADCDRKALYYLPARPRDRSSLSSSPRLVIPKGECRDAILEMFHSSPWGGHFGIKKTAKRIAQRYYWPGLMQDIAKYIGSCDACLRVKSERHPQGSPRKAPPSPSEPFEFISFDYIGPLECIQHTVPFTYILTVIDHFTNWAIAIPTSDMTAATTARALVEEVFCQHGVPRMVLHDRAAAFNDQLMTELKRMLGIQCLLTTAYRAKGNGRVEKFNGTCQQILETLAHSERKNWLDCLPFAVFAYNTSPSEALKGMSPFFALYGREAPTLMDRVLSSSSESVSVLPLTDAIVSLQDDIVFAHTTVADVLEQRRAQLSNQPVITHPVYAEGDLVYLRSAGMNLTNSKTAIQRYLGPYKVVARRGDTTYRLQPAFILPGHKQPSSMQTTVHAERLRRYPQTSDAPHLASAGDAATSSSAVPRIPSGHPRSGVGATSQEHAMEMVNDIAERHRAERAADEPGSPAPDADPPPVTELVTSTGPASAVVQRRTGDRPYRPNYNENARMPSQLGHYHLQGPDLSLLTGRPLTRGKTKRPRPT